MEIEMLALASASVHFVLVIVLGGILIVEYFKRMEKFRRGFLGYGAFLIVILTFFVFDIYRNLVSPSVLINWINLFLASLANILFVVTSLINFNKINKKLFFSVPPFSIGIVIIEILRLMQIGRHLEIYTAIATLVATILAYIIIIGFLINVSEKRKKEKKIEKKTNWKWHLSLIVLIVIILLISIGINIFFFSTQKQQLSSELFIYNWEDYFDEDEKLIEDFEDEFGVNIILKYYDDENVAFEELIGGSEEYDLVIFRDALVREGIERGLFEEINKKNIGNLKKYIKKDFSYDEGNKYSIPYLEGTTGLIFNTNYISEGTNSWGILWDKRHAGKMAVLDSYFEVFALTLRNIGHSVNSNNPFEIMEANEFLELQKGTVSYMSYVEIKDKLLSEELLAGQMYSDVVSVILEEQDNFKYIIPKEGAVQWIDNFVIPLGAKNKITAEVFLDYMLRPEIGARVVKYNKIPHVGEKANELAMVDLIIPTEEELKRLEIIDLGATRNVDELKKELWEKLNE